MKRVPPSVRLKEEIEGLLQGSECPSAPAEPPMVGFVGRLARYMLQVARRTRRRSSTVGHTKRRRI